MIVDVSPAGMIIVDQNGKITLANPQALRWFGYEADELVGQRIEVLVADKHRKEHEATRTAYQHAPTPRDMAGGRDLYGRRKDGTEFPVDISLHPIETDSGPMILANIIDARPRHEAERNREMRASMEKLALLGQLAGGVAHEIRTPLCVISNDVYFLQSASEQLGEDARECVKEIGEAVAKANGIVSELLDFTRDISSEPESASVKAIVDSAVKLAAIAEPVALSVQVDEDFDVLVDADQVERILVNLLRNGAQAIQGKGQVSLRVERRDSSAIFKVCDSGGGVKQADIDRIFEPLFTTKPKGIGLGLAVSKRYAERNGGQLVLTSSGDTGTTFELRLPIGQSGAKDATDQ